jgi:hypothetical protein
VPSITDLEFFNRLSLSFKLARVLSASFDTSLATTPNPRPYSPARAASIEALRDNKIQGTTQIDSNNSSYLKNTFKATTFPKYGAASYFRDLSEEVEITKLNNSGWYEVKIRSFSKVLRPAFAPNVTFQDQIQSGFEKKFEEKSLSILSQIYSNM